MLQGMILTFRTQRKEVHEALVEARKGGEVGKVTSLTCSFNRLSRDVDRYRQHMTIAKREMAERLEVVQRRNDANEVLGFTGDMTDDSIETISFDELDILSDFLPTRQEKATAAFCFSWKTKGVAGVNQSRRQ